MRLFVYLLGLALAGCLAPPGASERATDAARELNLASRFGRMDVALGLTAQGVRESFLKHRAAWGRDVRVLDVELGSFSMPSGDHAAVEVDYSWSHNNESQLRMTRVAQDWRDNGGGFKLVRERRIAGDVGLFGEVAAAPTAAPARDVQFATKVIP
ncbi:MAG TPA: hypothetical protein VG937_39900 [Polyangiaceae bacterium]|jgi:hypothetical protein|nr:hypothetical protein [Polyangiaceae bacterium]